MATIRHARAAVRSAGRISRTRRGHTLPADRSSARPEKRTLARRRLSHQTHDSGSSRSISSAQSHGSGQTTHSGVRGRSRVSHAARPCRHVSRSSRRLFPGQHVRQRPPSRVHERPRRCSIGILPVVAAAGSNAAYFTMIARFEKFAEPIRASYGRAPAIERANALPRNSSVVISGAARAELAVSIYTRTISLKPKVKFLGRPLPAASQPSSFQTGEQSAATPRPPAATGAGARPSH